MKKNLALFLKKKKIPSRITKQIFKAIWVGSSSIAESENTNEFTIRKLDFESKFEDAFENTEYISKYLEKLEKYILEPFFATGENRHITTNPAECNYI